jgi:phosphohistidine phosphatase
MKLVLMRHGQAVDREEFLSSQRDDALRPLTDRGKSRSEKMAQKLVQWLGKEWVVLHSPYVRARQTTNAIKPFLKVQAQKEVVELVPSAPPQAICDLIRREYSQANAILCVGHEPHLSTLASYLLSGLNQGFLELKKSGLIALEIENFASLGPGRSELLFLVSPKITLENGET